MHPVQTAVKRSLRVLENNYVRLALVALLVLYSSGVVPELNYYVSLGLGNMWVRLLVLLLVMVVSTKDVPLALLLAVAYVLTVHMGAGVSEGMAMPATEEEEREDLEHGDEEPVSEGFDGQGAAPHGYNPVDGDQPCLNQCADGNQIGAAGNGNCDAAAAFEGESNAQGMNCPMGFGGNELASF